MGQGRFRGTLGRVLRYTRYLRVYLVYLPGGPAAYLGRHGHLREAQGHVLARGGAFASAS